MRGNISREEMLPRTYSPEAVRIYLRRIRLAQQTGLTNFDEVFDPAISRLIKSHADVIGCPRETILCSLLVAVAACMGPNTDVKVDSDWSEKPILWIMVAGRRGDCKTPALNRVKSAVAGLEREIQALHKAQALKQNRQCPTFLVDQHNYNHVNAQLKMPSDSQNLIGMFDNFGTFLRSSSLDSMFLDPSILLSMYDSMPPLTSNGDLADSNSRLCCNFLGMIEAIDAAALLEKFDADGLSDRVLVVCPKVPGCKMALESANDSQGNQATLQMILSTIRNYHQVQDVIYTLREDGRAAFQRCLAEIELWQSGFICDERRRGVLAKAPGQLARLSAVLSALKNGLDLCARGSKAHLLPSSAITAETVIAARQILMYLINQKMAFLPNDESLAEDSAWDDMAENIRVEMNSPSSLDVPQMVHKDVQERIYLPQRGRHNSGPKTKKAQDRVIICGQESGREITHVSSHHRKTATQEPEISQNSKQREGVSHSVITSLLISETDSKIVNPSRENSNQTGNDHLPNMSMKRGADATGGDTGSVKMMRLKRERHQGDVMAYSVDDNSDGDEDVDGDSDGHGVDCSPVSSGTEINEDVAGTSIGSTSWKFAVAETNHDSNFICKPENKFPKFDLVPSAFRSFRTTINMFQLTDDQLLTQCGQKIKRLLLLPGMVASSASICQKRLFPPVPKELRVEHPRTTHPVWGALAFLKRLVHMGLGELVHPLHRMQAIHFRKIRLEYMRQDARALFQRIDLDEEEYEKSYPKFDDSHLTTFVLIEDIDRAVRQRLKADGQTIRRY